MFVSWSASGGSLCLFVIMVFFIHLDHSCGNVLSYLQLHTLGVRRPYCDVLI